LGEIEAQLTRASEVEEAVVVVREELLGDKRLVAYVVGEASAEKLRAHLKTVLPEYMVPSAFVSLDALPLTSSGKVDRKSLPAPDGQLLGAKEYEAPQGHIESTLAHIWQEVLGAQQMGRHDNFFEVGGHSLKAIQVVNRANQSAMKITVAQMFEHPTVAELARVTTASEAKLAAQQSGDFPLTPVMLTALRIHPNRILQNIAGTTFECRKRLNPGLLEQTLRHLMANHDALRLRVCKTEQGWRQRAVSLDEIPPGAIVESRDLSAVPPADLDTVLKEIRQALIDDLDLAKPVLLRIALCELGSGQAQRLIFAIHHVAFDVLSMDVLYEDLWATYARLESGQSPLSSRRPASFMDWVSQMNSFAHSDAALPEVEYWRSTLSRFRESQVRPTVPPEAAAHYKPVSLSMSESETQELLHHATRTLRAQAEELLLTAICVAYSKVHGPGPQLIELTRHGRASGIGGIDVSRTVGWFSCEVPVALDTTTAVDLLHAVNLTKQQLRAIPHDGVGYGIARHLVPGDPLHGLPEPMVGLNYQGEGGGSNAGHLTVMDTSHSELVLQTAKRPGMLNVMGFVAAGQLQLFWPYDPQFHCAEQVRMLADTCATLLREIVRMSKEPAIEPAVA
jgi:non-ribosomal peptide synthase protein (TIGR01720 family)